MSSGFADRNPVDSVVEREIDLLLLMALHSSASFRAFVAEKAAGTAGLEFVDAWRGVADQAGESDLCVLFKDADGQRLAVLIEDKIDAAFQPDQAGRYRKRGVLGVGIGHWDRFVACLCAPERYAKPLSDAGDWDAILTYEEIEARLTASGDSFAPFVCLALARAIDKQRSGAFAPNPAATAFWREYKRLQRNDFPNLSLTAVGDLQSINEPWPRFAAASLPPDVLLEHKAWKGCVDLTFSGMSCDELRRRLGRRLPPGCEIARVGRSAAVRRRVPEISHAEPFAPQAKAVADALRAVGLLLQFWREIDATALTAAAAETRFAEPAETLPPAAA